LSTVVHNSDKCIGCRYCTWICPYDAPKYNTSKGIIEKCTLCQELLVNGEKPACVRLCPTAALEYDILPDHQQDFPVGFTNTNIKPSIYIKPIKYSSGPECDSKYDDSKARLNKEKKSYVRKNTLKEWPLAGFTFLISVMYALICSNIISDIYLPELVFISLGIIAAGLTFFHLGKKIRAWRSVLNFSRSWLSREILSFILFTAFSIIYLSGISGALSLYLSLFTGGFMIISADMIYVRVSKNYSNNIHSALISLTSIFLIAWFSEALWLFMIFAILKMILFPYRTLRHYQISDIKIGCVIINKYF